MLYEVITLSIPFCEERNRAMFTKSYIPFRGYFSSPYAKWQGTLANFHSIELAAQTTRRWLEGRAIDPKLFDYVYLGYTVHQKQAFYGGPWTAALIGADHVPGLTA